MKKICLVDDSILEHLGNLFPKYVTMTILYHILFLCIIKSWNMYQVYESIYASVPMPLDLYNTFSIRSES